MSKTVERYSTKNEFYGMSKKKFSEFREQAINYVLTLQARIKQE